MSINLKKYIFTASSSDVIEELTTEESHPLSNILFSEVDVHEILISLQPTKCMGIDSIGPRILKECASILYQPLYHLF